MAVLASDNFNRANNGDLGTAWDVMTSEMALTVSSNTAVPNVMGNDCTETNNSVTWPDNQYSQAVVTVTGGTSGGGEGAGVCVRGSASARTYYRIIANAAATNNVEIAKFSGGYTQLAVITSSWSGANTMKAEISGSAPATITVYKNGSSIGSTTDSSIASGRAGATYSATVTTAVLDDWEGGDAAAAGTNPKGPLSNPLAGPFGGPI